jgi:hypothetical protein
LPGLVVELRGASVATDGDTMARYLLLSPASSVIVRSQSVRSLLSRAPSLCCRRPLEAAVAMGSIPDQNLWDYALAGRKSARGPPSGLGCVHLTLTRVCHVSLRVRRACFGTVSCDVCGHGGVVLEADLVADAEDGTATGRLSCSGFRNVMDALAAAEPECRELRRIVLQCGSFTYDALGHPVRNSGLAPPQLSHPASAHQAGRGILARLARSAPRRVVAFLRMDREPPPAGADSVQMNGSIHLGRGKKLVTAVAAGAHTARADCVAVYEDRTWTDRAGGTAHHSTNAGRGGVSTVQLIERHIAGAKPGNGP